MFEGIILGILTLFGVLIIYARLPKFLKKVFTFKPLWTDIGGFFLAYFILASISRSIVALFAAAIFGIFISGLLTISQKRKEASVIDIQPQT